MAFGKKYLISYFFVNRLWSNIVCNIIIWLSSQRKLGGKCRHRYWEKFAHSPAKHWLRQDSHHRCCWKICFSALGHQAYKIHENQDTELMSGREPLVRVSDVKTRLECDMFASCRQFHLHLKYLIWFNRSSRHTHTNTNTRIQLSPASQSGVEGLLLG